MPKNLDLGSVRKKQEKESGVAVIVSFLLIVLPISFSIWLYFDGQYKEERIEVLASEIKKVDEKISEEISGNKLLLLEDSASTANLLLSEQPRFTNIINTMQDNLVGGVYFNSLVIDLEGGSFEGVAKDFSSLVSQIVILRDLSIFNSLVVETISVDEENGYFIFNAKFKFDKAVLLN